MKLSHFQYYFPRLLICLMMTISLRSQEDLDKKIDYKSEELQKIRDEIKAHKSDLMQVQSREKSLLSQLEQTEKEMSLTAKLVQQLNREQQLKTYQIEQTKQAIGRLSQNLDKLKSDFAKRLVYLYKQGKYSDWELILTSQSINQAFYRYKYLRILSDIDKKTADHIHFNIVSINNKKNQLTEELADQNQIIAEKKRYQQNLAVQKRQRDSQLNLAKKDKNNLIAQIREKEKAAKQLSDLIANLEKERETRRQELERQRQLAGIREKNPFLDSQGRLEWPVYGQVVGKFGLHKHPTLNTLTENSGIDIEVRKGTPVRSVLDGVVTTITYIRGFGNTIIIDHGSGFYTVYSHVENVNVYEKEYVTKKTVIAEVGDSGSLSGALLHFEIWSNRTKLNPEEWLTKRS